jgi:hypothetical protein
LDVLERGLDPGHLRGELGEELSERLAAGARVDRLLKRSHDLRNARGGGGFLLLFRLILILILVLNHLSLSLRGAAVVLLVVQLVTLFVESRAREGRVSGRAAGGGVGPETRASTARRIISHHLALDLNPVAAERHTG